MRVEHLQVDHVHEKLVGEGWDALVAGALEEREACQAREAAWEGRELVVAEVEVLQVGAHAHGFVELGDEVVGQVEGDELQQRLASGLVSGVICLFYG